MVFRKDVPSFIKVVLAGVAAGSLCALLDLIPADNIWTFSSFSGSLGFWAVTGMLILMQSEKRLLAGVNVFLYFAFMNAAFFFVHLALPFEFPRIATLEEAVGQSLVWLDGKFTYTSKDALLNFMIEHMPNPEGLPAEDRRTRYDGWLSQLKHWK